MSNQSASKSNQKHKKKSHNTVLRYLRHVLGFVGISLLLVVPLCLVLLNASVKTVHRVQPYFGKRVSDIVLNDEAYTPSALTSGSTVKPALRAGDKIGVLRCDAIGLETPVYFGSNRIARRSGAGLSVKHSLPGQGKEILISGNIYGTFRGVAQLEEDDEIVLETSWGIYRYTVTGSEISKEPPQADTFETLILSVQTSDEAFAALNDAHRYIVAEIASGPSIEEVQS